jgi:hypothetical protein
MLPPLDSAASVISSAASQIPTAFMTPSVFDQPYTILEPAYVKQPDYRIKTATTDNQPKAKQQETANYEQLKRYLDSTQQQQPSVIPTGPTPKIFESLNPFRQIQTHYELKEQREQQEQKERELLREKGKGKGKNHRQRLIEERTQGYEAGQCSFSNQQCSFTNTNGIHDTISFRPTLHNLGTSLREATRLPYQDCHHRQSTKGETTGNCKLRATQTILGFHTTTTTISHSNRTDTQDL